MFKDGKIVDKDKAKKLIGGKSFSVNPNHEENRFGLIKSLSHVRLQRTKDGKCTDLEFKPLFGELDLNKNTQSDGSHNYQPVSLPDIDKKAYNAKKPLKTYLTDGKGEWQVSEFFKEDRRIGISRDIKTGKTGEDALFIQISYRFAQDARYCFAFEAEIDDCLPLEQYNQRDTKQNALRYDQCSLFALSYISAPRGSQDSSLCHYRPYAIPLFEFCDG